MKHPDITLIRSDTNQTIAVTIAGIYGATVKALTDDTIIRIDGGPAERPGRGAARYVIPLAVILVGGPSSVGELATIRHHTRPTWKAWRAERRDAYLAAIIDHPTPHTDEVA